MSKLALEPTQSYPTVLGALSLEVKWLKREADHSPPTSAEVKECMELYLHSPDTPSWHGAQLKKNTGTTLPLYLLLFTNHSYVITQYKNLLSKF
jgi:hypothetical protein